MGVNICVYKKLDENTFERIPEDEWDVVRQGYDSVFYFETLCQFTGPQNELFSDFILCRPVNLDSELIEINKIPDEYKERYEYLINLLKNNPDYWVHWSY